MGKKLTPEMQERVKEVLTDWNKKWRKYYQKARLSLLFNLSPKAVDFLNHFEVTGSYPIYGTLLYGRYKDKKVIVKLDYNEAGWLISFSGNKNLKPLQEELELTDEQMQNFDTFMDDYDFNGVINAIKIAERKDVVDERREKYKGCKVADFIKKGSTIRVVLDNGEDFAYGDFLQFRGNLNSITRN